MSNFTRGAEDIIQGAKTEVRRYGSSIVDDFHILLSLLASKIKRPANLLLEEWKIDYESVSSIIVNGHSYTPNDPPWTYDAQNVLNRAREIAEIRHSNCRPEHLLIGLLMVNGVADNNS